MKKVRIFGALAVALCAMAVAPQISEADFRMPNAATQEHYARKWVSKYTVSTSPNGAYWREQANIALRRICRYNGVTIVNEPFKHTNDYRTKVHPVEVYSSGVEYAECVAAGHISLSEFAYKKAHQDQFDYYEFEHTFAHELGHAVLGHGIGFVFWGKSSSTREGEAEQKSLDHVVPLPEGGWGAYVAGKRKNTCYAKHSIKVFSRIEKGAKDIVKLNIPYKKGDNYLNWPASIYPTYQGTDGKTYEIIASEKEKGRKYRSFFAAGQMAECIAKDAFYPRNLAIVENTMKKDIPYLGSHLLICKSPNLPNGYRILSDLYFSEGTDKKWKNVDHYIALVQQGEQGKNGFGTNLAAQHKVIKQVLPTKEYTTDDSEAIILELVEFALDNEKRK